MNNIKLKSVNELSFHSINIFYIKLVILILRFGTKANNYIYIKNIKMILKINIIIPNVAREHLLHYLQPFTHKFTFRNQRLLSKLNCPCFI